MKIATVVSRHGLTLAQWGVLSTVRRGPLHRVRDGWRGRGSRRAERHDVLTRLEELGAIRIGTDRVEITDAGSALIASVEGRR